MPGDNTATAVFAPCGEMVYTNFMSATVLPPQSSLARRYAGKLFANIASVPMYLIMEAVLPRALGVQTYGNYNFAVSVFTQFTAFLDMGTSTCFYNALSRRPSEYTLVTFYLRVTGLVLLITLTAGMLLLIPNIGTLLLPEVPLWYAPSAALFGFLLWGTRVVRSMNDALGLTVPGEMVRSVVHLGAALLLTGLFWTGALRVETLFGVQYLMFVFMIAGSLAIMRHCFPKPEFSLTHDRIRAYRREFTDYSAPLFVQALLSAAAMTVERWLLQWVDGGVQQGYFALSQRTSMACFMFVSAMTPLLMRELSIAWGRDDREHMGALFSRFAPLLFAVAAWFSCFAALEASVLVSVFGGGQFAQALLPVQIMALYPAHQVYGQLAGSVFHATGQTRILRNAAFVEHAGGFLLVWMLVCPSHLGGLGLGAAGLALKTVLGQIVAVNVLLWLASKIIPLRFARNLALQFLIPGIFALLAWCSRELSVFVLGDANFLLRFFCSGICYTILSVGTLLCFPILAGCSRSELSEQFTRLHKRILS